MASDKLGAGVNRGRGPGKWTAAAPSAEFLASLRPVCQAGGPHRQPPVILAQPPPVPLNLGPTLPKDNGAAELPPPGQPGPGSNKCAAQQLKERMLRGGCV